MQLVESGGVSEDVIPGSNQGPLGVAEAVGGRDALMLVDEAGCVVHANDEWLLLSGHESIDLVGKPVCDGPAAKDCEALDLLRHSLVDGVSRAAIVYMRHRRGFQLKLRAQVTPICNAEDDASGFIIRLRLTNG